GGDRGLQKLARGIELLELQQGSSSGCEKRGIGRRGLELTENIQTLGRVSLGEQLPSEPEFPLQIARVGGGIVAKIRQVTRAAVGRIEIQIFDQAGLRPAS